MPLMRVSLDQICFNPYSVGSRLGSVFQQHLQLEKNQVSILIQLEVGWEDDPEFSDALKELAFQSLFSWK